ncbi:MAG: nucleoside triphosphate pyrophosphohydrolase [Luteolibacter sp.]
MIDCPDDAKQLDRLRAIMHRLRAPGGCPWDAEQSHASLIPNLIEECYETVDAIRRDDMEHMREELGDLLLQVVFHSELAEESGKFDLNAVARGVSDKLVRRHPHVFAKSGAQTSDEVLSQWDEIKRSEKGHEKEERLHGVGQGLPGLLRAAKLQKKAAKLGFYWPDESSILDKIREEIDELVAAMESGDAQAVDDELADLMFSVVNLIRFRKTDPEMLMEAANRKFMRRFAAMDAHLSQSGIDLESANLGQMEAAWTAIKRAERGAAVK